jgi:hypothetical protein
MTAHETMLSDSALPDPDPSPSAGDRWPATAPPPASNGQRTESYRQLWQPPGRRPAHRQALGQPYVWAGDEPSPDGDNAWPEPAERRATALAAWPAPRSERRYRRPRHGDLLGAPAALTERPVIGDLLRLPMAWCQEGSCISWYADPAASGEADVRARAIAAGWCTDAIGRLICPDCQQRFHVWSARPVVPMAGRQAGRDRRPARRAGRAGQHRRQY